MDHKKKIIPKFETKAWSCHVFINRETGRKMLLPDFPQYMQMEIDRFSVGDLVLVKATNKKQKRTDAQNRYMHLYFSLIALPTGYTPRQVKIWAKGKILAEGITEVFGDKVRDVKDTHELTKLEFMEFIARIEAETEVPAPDAGPFQLSLTHDEWTALKEEQKKRYMAFKPKLEGLSTP